MVAIGVGVEVSGENSIDELDPNCRQCSRS